MKSLGGGDHGTIRAAFLGGLLKDGALAFVRHFLAGIGAWLVGAGYASHADEQTGLGALMTAIGLSWSFYVKYDRARQLQAAKALVTRFTPP